MSVNKFVLIVPFAPQATQNAILAFVQESGWGFWHYGADTWLLAMNESLDAQILRDKIQQILPGMQFAVLRVEMPKEAINWGSYGPPNWAEWFRQVWEK